MQSLFGKRSKSSRFTARTATKGRSRPVRILGLSSSPNVFEVLQDYHTTRSTLEARNEESTQEHSILRPCQQKSDPPLPFAQWLERVGAACFFPCAASAAVHIQPFQLKHTFSGDPMQQKLPISRTADEGRGHSR